MKFTLPTQHVLYFGIQEGKLDASGSSKAISANIAEMHNQVAMMLGHEIVDFPPIKGARNWLGNKLGASKRSQVMFMDRDDILNLFVVTNLPLPIGALTKSFDDDGLPF